jgi:molybdopterin-containing oxidoreductase family iron-sulfur binding subunit
VYDGRYSNLGWLQECPDPITKLVWDNAALMNKTDADNLTLKTGDMIEIKLASHTLEIPVYVLWGQPKGVITLPLGYGRTDAGPIGGDVSAPSPTEPVGFNTYKLRRSNEMYSVISSPTLNKLGKQYTLVTTQDFQQMDTWGTKGEIERLGVKGQSGTVVRDAPLAEYKAKPDFVNHVGHRLPLLQLWDAPYPDVETAAKIRENDPGAPTAFNVPHAWGMAIDMSSCIGCMACVVACQSENNIPTVGKAMTKMNREMHWIRIDRYFKPPTGADRKATDFENVDVVYQPMMCVHCESAPCEQVCPVAATVHDTEGLNTMVYNRCIGTRYCSNNCPYKVRRFNYMDWHSRSPRKGAGLELVASAWLGIPDTQQSQSVEHVRRMVYNPEVSVRMRGVMEKCTYCTQRIKAATIKKKADWAKGTIPHGQKANGQPAFTVDDFDVVTACQQACPTQAITFGNLLDKGSAVRERHDVKRTYTVLEDLNTRARTKYMAKIRNPNTELASAAPAPAAAEHG